TTPNSVAKKYAKKYGMPVIVRNTFIDNKRDYIYIQDQLKKAIKIAKKNGYAIAIGHPHSITLKVLKESKHLLKGVEPIFINQLPYL
ncbi:divergent polysaccharide deacetylase family protein, partial [Poseidonibacter sp.]|uniref:divergent polysaccharide deacetylase family protein n=1 Tax=Poseidonibacter sp. TaxID=2321188 RepID=UPI003C72FE43